MATDSGLRGGLLPDSVSVHAMDVSRDEAWRLLCDWTEIGYEVPWRP